MPLLCSYPSLPRNCLLVVPCLTTLPDYLPDNYCLKRGVPELLYLETFFMLRGGAHDGALRPDCPAVVFSLRGGGRCV